MSIKMTLSGALKKTSGSNFNEEWSALTWVRWDSFPGTDVFACILSKDNANAFSVLEYLNGWVRTNIWGPNYVNLHQPQLRTWYCYFMTEKMPQNTWPNARAGYIKYGERRWTTISSWSNNVGDVSCDMFFGGNGWNETVDGHMQIAKYWKANLTDEELMREAYSLMPLREANLYFANTLDTYRDAQRDMSGNGNNFNNAVVLPKPGNFAGPIKRSSGLILPEYHWESSATDWCEFQLTSLSAPTLGKEKIRPTDSSAGSALSASSCTVSLTSSGFDRLLVVGVSHTGGSSYTLPTHDSVTFNSIPLTRQITEPHSSNEMRTSLWTLLNPPEGTYDVVATLSGTAGEVMVTATCYANVDSAAAFGTAVSAEGTTGTATVNASSAAGELVVDVVGINRTTMTVGSGQIVQRKIENVNSTSAAGTSHEAGDSTVTMSWTLGTGGYGDFWTICALPLKPVGTRYVLRVRRYKSGEATIKHVYALVDGSTVIQEWEDSNVPTGVSRVDLPVTNAAAITSHSNLRGRVRAIKVS